METNFPVTVTYSARGIPTYHCEVSHKELGKYTVIRSGNPDILSKKVLAQAMQWNAAWEKQSAAERRIRAAYRDRDGRRLHIDRQKEIALDRTTQAQQLLDMLRSILVTGIEVDPTLDWEQLKVKRPFPAIAPRKPHFSPEPAPNQPRPAPNRCDKAYDVKFSMLDRLIASRRKIKVADAERRFLADMSAWNDACIAIAANHAAAIEAHRTACAELQKQHLLAFARWKEEKAAYEEEQLKQHAEVNDFRKQYESKSANAVIEYFARVMLNSDYPACIPREFEFELNQDTGILLVNCKLPAPDDLPGLTEVKYVQSTDTFVEKLLSGVQSTRLYDDVIYQLTLRTLHELFHSDAIKILSTIVLNGMVTSTDKSTGKEFTACILSVQASRDVFLAINLEKVDPKACFRQLRGVGSSKLHSTTPVAPIMELRRDDARFIASYGVADQLNEGYNLAAMDWEDFEHLIREIFEKEFSYTGGEVKVTQASRDGGVDAIAFDPDPIRGGKIAIQAKRYAYTVGVSAVRDLYGTVLNEGASKGILVTTSDYGPDAYEFASGKPLTLLSGSNLLHLLGKHGVNAHIDLKEARRIAHERANRATA